MCLTRNATRTLSRETALGLNFAQVNYYDGQGFLIPKKLGVKSAKELDGAAVCVLPGTTTELNVADYFRSNGMKMKPVVIENTAELAKAFFAGRCDCLTSDASQLAGTRAVAPNPKTITSSCRKSSPRSPWHRRCAMATTSGSISSTFPSWP
jgi:general L-amino acid transport system substrate-binding protein